MAGSSDEAGPSRPRQKNQNLTVRYRDHGRKRRSDGGGAEPSRRRRTEEPSPPPERDADLDVYDPDQSVLERRRIQREMREMQQNVKANPDEFLQKDPKAILEHLAKAEGVLRNVKQTGEAAIDARGLVIVADLAARRVQRLTAGNVGNGIDVDEFVSKSISYMKHGRGIEDDEAHELSSTQRHRRRPQRGAIGADDDDDNGDDGDPFNWSHLGRYAVVQCIRRPAVPGFLMGPLSIEKKARKMTQRSGPFKVSNLLEVRPQELKAEDLKKNDKNDLPSICKKIYVHLENAQQESQDAVENELNDEATSDDEREIMNRHSLRSTGGIDLLRFVINPRSFGQTVENLFYVSFLIREGSIKLTFDNNGLPALGMCSPSGWCWLRISRGNRTRAKTRNGRAGRVEKRGHEAPSHHVH